MLLDAINYLGVTFVTGNPGAEIVKVYNKTVVAEGVETQE